jgi:uncharacterized protein (DUF58 family)
VKTTPLVVPPARQGPGPLHGRAVARLRIGLRRRAHGLLPGDHPTAGVGRGLELAQLRPYEAGDDIRRLDPAASARTGVAHVRLDVPERAVTTWLVLDVSASMAFGTADRLKSDVAEGVAEAIGHLAVRRGGRLAVAVAGPAGARGLPARGGRSALAALRVQLRDGVAADAAPAPGRPRDGTVAGAGGPPMSGIADALVRVDRLARSRGVVVVISDFREPGWAQAMKRVSARHTVIAVEVADPRESELPDAGLLVLVDPETGELVEADAGHPAVRAAYAEGEAGRRAEVTATLRRAGARHVTLSTDGDWLRELGRALR